MSYQVLARKWRPQKFSELVGQEHVVNAITNALENNKLHHAYLFTGTRGVGKTTIARIFSKSLNCEQGQSANPCGICPTCLDISDGRYVDLLEIDAASRTKVEDTRELLDNVQYRPTRGKYKVYLIDEVHMLSKHSFNALLKTLEEPPEHVKFLLATTDPQKLPVTILSRCLQFNLKALSKEQIHNHLAFILKQEDISYEVPAIEQLSKAAQGSIRDSLSLTDQAIAQGNNVVTFKTVASMLGLLNRNHLIRLLKFISERDGIKSLEILEDICSQSPDYAQILSQLLALIHQVALTQIVPDICKLENESARAIYTLSKALSKEHIQVLYQIGVNGKRDLSFAPDARTGLEMTILRMLAFSPAKQVPINIEELESSEPEVQEEFQQSNLQTLSSTEVESKSPSKDSVGKKSDDTQNVTGDYFNENHSTQAIDDVQDSNEQTSSVAESKTDKVELSSDLEVFDTVTEKQDQDKFPEHNAEQSTEENSDLSNEQMFSISHSLKENDFNDDYQAEPNEHEHHNTSSEVDSMFNVDSDKPIERNNESSTPSKSSYMRTLELLRAEKEIDDLNINDENTRSNVSQESSELEVDENILKARTDFKFGHALKPFDGDLSAYLNNGDKLISASQVDEWSAFVDSTDLQAYSRLFLLNTNCSELQNPLNLIVSEENYRLFTQEVKNNIEEKLSTIFEQKVELQVEQGQTKNTPYILQQQIKESRLAHARMIVSNDQNIQELKKAFDAEVLQDSIEVRPKK